MNTVIEIITCIAVLLCLIYTVMIARFGYGWIMSNPPAYDNKDHDIFVTIIVPVRNEADFVEYPLDTLLNQSYAKTHFEIIVVDDHSTDNTIELIQKKCAEHKLLKLIKNNGEGKKSAIESAIIISTAELIITVDADCFVTENWLSEIIYFYKQTQAKMIVAPVYIPDSDGALSTKLQSLEFMALMISGGGALYFKNAIMCNGANLAYTRKVFLEVNGFEGINQTATGDDVLLMYKIKKKYPDGIKFLKSENAIVSTNPAFTFNEFINQRKRWASKKFNDLNTETKLTSLVVYFFSLFLIVLPLAALFNPVATLAGLPVIKIFILLFATKCMIDFLLLLLATSFFKERKLLLYFLPEQIIYIFYVVIIGFMGMNRNYEWKERTINEK